MAMTKFAAAVNRQIERGQQEKEQQGYDGTRLKNQVPGKVLPPTGNTGTGYTPGDDSVTTSKLADDAVTFAKMQEIATDRLIGRDTTGTGDPELLTVGGGVEFTGSGGIQRSALTGDVTASAGSNSTTIANDAVTYAKIQNVSAASKLLGRGDSGSGDTQEITLGTGLTMTGTTLASSGGSAVTIEEVDGTPSESAPTKLIFPNGTLSVSTHEVTYTPSGGGSIDVTDGTTTVSPASTLRFPSGTVTDNGSGEAEYTPSGGGGADAVGTGTSAVTIGGLAGSPDVNGVGGAGLSFEFEAGDAAPTWNGAPNATDVGTTAASHLYVKNNSGTELRGLYAWTPGSGVFDARCKVAGIATDANGAGGAFGLLITSSGDAERLLLEFEFVNGGQWVINGYSYAGGGYTARYAGNFALTGANDEYLRITRDGSNNCTFWISSNGLAWQHLATFSFTLTVANAGFRSTGDGTGITHAYVDWLRTSV